MKPNSANPSMRQAVSYFCASALFAVAAASAQVGIVGDDRAACQARVQGLGSTSGSIQGGGVIKQIETIVVPPVP